MKGMAITSSTRPPGDHRPTGARDDAAPARERLRPRDVRRVLGVSRARRPGRSAAPRSTRRPPRRRRWRRRRPSCRSAGCRRPAAPAIATITMRPAATTDTPESRWRAPPPPALVARRQLLAVAADDQQRVVDAGAEAEHHRELRANSGSPSGPPGGRRIWPTTTPTSAPTSVTNIAAASGTAGSAARSRSHADQLADGNVCSARQVDELAARLDPDASPSRRSRRPSISASPSALSTSPGAFK